MGEKTNPSLSPIPCITSPRFCSVFTSLLHFTGRGWVARLQTVPSGGRPASCPEALSYTVILTLSSNFLCKGSERRSGRTPGRVFRALKGTGRVQAWTAQSGLPLHSNKTRIVDARRRGGFDFLGYHFERGYRWPRKESLKKFKDTVQTKTRRRSRRPLQASLRT